MEQENNEGRYLQVVEHSSFIRFVPPAVVTAVVIGFVALAWYAYHAGTQSVSEADLLVVEADKTPMKEKPLDPGGMKFPNQDKTIFETFAGGQKPARVERVLPAPEEPMPKNMDMSETTGFVNPNARPELAAAGGPADPVQAPAEATAPRPQIVEAQPQAVVDNAITSYTAKKPAEEKPAPAPAAEKPAEKPAIKKPHIISAGDKGVKVQLGAFKSEKEAQDQWTKLQKKIDILADKAPLIVKADLGAKGVFYRLRIAGFAGDADAKAFCANVTAKGQACIPAPN